MTTTTAHRQADEVQDALRPKASARERAETGVGVSQSVKRLLTPVSSLKLTVVLFVFGLVLVFLGTVVQVEKGIWDVMGSVFRTWIARIELSPFFPDSIVAGTFLETGWFPFPGGWTIGTLMLINLVAAHTVRFKLVAEGDKLLHGVVGTALGLLVIVFAVLASVYEVWPLPSTLEFWPALMMATAGLLILLPPSFWLYGKRTGIVLLHAGIILLLVNELITGLGAVEGQAHILQKQSTNYLVDIENTELVIVHKNNPGGEMVVSIPEDILRQEGKVEHDGLPFGVEVLKWYPNTSLVPLFASEEISQLAQQILRPMIDKRVEAARQAASEGDFTKAVAIYDDIFIKLAPADKRQRELLLQSRTEAAMRAQAAGQDFNAAEPPAFDDGLSEQDITFARKLAAREMLTDEDIDTLAAFFDEFEADRDSEEWRTHGKAWRRYHARGGDAGKLWIENLQRVEPNLADGEGGYHEFWRIRHIREGVGVDSKEADMPAAYVRISDAGENSGVYLFHANLNEPQHKFTNDNGKELHTSLRFQRMYKPYTIHLIEFRHDRYTGTNKAKNFSSEILLIDKDHPNGLRHIIRMNDPLRYKGETFFQASFKPGDAGTVLQVVRNPGYLLPYIACIVVSLGLCIHFGQTLRRFIRRSSA